MDANVCLPFTGDLSVIIKISLSLELTEASSYHLREFSRPASSVLRSHIKVVNKVVYDKINKYMFPVGQPCLWSLSLSIILCAPIANRMRDSIIPLNSC